MHASDVMPVSTYLFHALYGHRGALLLLRLLPHKVKRALAYCCNSCRHEIGRDERCAYDVLSNYMSL